MAIIGLGTDIVSIERIEKALKRTPGFASRILTPRELLRFEQTAKKASFLAKRFASKEAAVKALGTGFSQGITFHQIEIEHDPLGKPNLLFFDSALSYFKQSAGAHIHLSISDEQCYACATVILES